MFVDIWTPSPGTPATGITPSDASSYLYRIENRWGDELDDRFLHTENFPIGYPDFDTWVAEWPRSGTVDVEYGYAPEEWWSSYWELVPFEGVPLDHWSPGEQHYYIRNRWTGFYIDFSVMPAWTLWGPYEDHSPSRQAITLEPRVVDGVHCFRIRCDFSAYLALYAHIEDQVHRLQTNSRVPSDWWSACWIFRQYPKW